MDDDDLGMDIGPDEEFPNYWQRCELPFSRQATEDLANGHDDDLQEDHGGVFESGSNRFHQAEAIGIRTSHRLQEPTDTASDSASTVHQRVFPARQQQHNGTSYYHSEERRLQTFSDWRFQHVVPKEQLARNGFIYTGTADKVRCTFCNVLLRQWDESDVVETEHRRASPRCPMVTGRGTDNIPYTPSANGHSLSCAASATPMDLQASPATGKCEGKGHDINPLEERYGSSYAASGRQNEDEHRRDSASEDRGAESAREASPRVQHMAILPARLETFKDWPPQMKQKPQQLAEAGLYYTGDGDRTKCYHCAVLLYNWDPQDDPFVEHARWFPDCQYMKLIKGEEFIKKCKSSHARNEDVLQTPAVLAVLHDGFSVEEVLKSVETLKKDEGVDVVISAQKILETIYKFEEDGSRNHLVQQQSSVSNGHDMEQLQRENESLKDKQLCKVCMERDVEVIFYPCKHFICCATCGSGLSQCPICRTVISSLDRVYMS